MTSVYIEEPDLSIAWGLALQRSRQPVIRDLIPLTVSITGFSAQGVVSENNAIRAQLDLTLKSLGKQSVHSVANTIFPHALWNQTRPRSELYSRYHAILPQLRSASSKNRHGLYFERMLSGGPVGAENQLEFAIAAYTARPGVRRSMLQVSVFQPTRDHSTAAMRGFPCLQHLTFAPAPEGLCVNAFYATQYLVERAYGNYLGICRLGQFVAHEIRVPLARVTCFTGIAEFDATKAAITDVSKVIAAALGDGQEG